MDKLLNEREAAAILGVVAGTLSVWRATRRYPLKFVKVGRAVRYRLADIEAFVNRNTEPGVAAIPPARKRRRG